MKNKNRDWHQSTEQPDYIVSNVEIIESYYYFQGLDVTRLFRFFRPRDVASWREINSYRALLSFRRYSSAFFSPRHTLPTSPHPPALGGLCALSLLNPIIHRDYSSTVRGPSPFFISFFFFFLFLSQLPSPLHLTLKTLLIYNAIVFIIRDAYLILTNVLTSRDVHVSQRN